jgi:hypothetical protein
MLNWHDMAAFYANNLKYEILTIPPQKCTILEDLEAKEALRLSSLCALSITGLEIPQFTSLGIKDLQNIGVSLKKIC